MKTATHMSFLYGRRSFKIFEEPKAPERYENTNASGSFRKRKFLLQEFSVFNIWAFPT